MINNRTRTSRPGSHFSPALFRLAALIAVCMLIAQNPSFAHQTKVDGSISETPSTEATIATDASEGRPARLYTPGPSQTNEVVTDHSVTALFRRADIVVQLVMGTLVLASVVCWTVFLTKLFELWWARRKLAIALAAIEHVRFLADDAELRKAENLIEGVPSLKHLIDAATRERQLSEGLVSDGTVIDRYLLRASEIVRSEARRMAAGTGLLATIGAIAPFVGLFGTVWGIMNSFIGIARAQTTNLAVVAPGIAEALLATAMGLVAAIPAVVFYNLLARSTKAYVEEAGEGSGMVVRMLSRELAQPDRRYAARAAE